MPQYDLLREFRNDVIRCTAAITASPRGPARDAALVEAKNVLREIMEWKARQ